MSWRSSRTRYGALAIAIHWVSAAAILALLILGFTAANTGDAALKTALLRAHLPLGILVFMLTVLRAGWWLFFDRRPDPVSGVSRLQDQAARLAHLLFYVLLLAMGASGIGLAILSGAAPVVFFGAPGSLPDFQNFPPMAAHSAGAFALLALATLHIGAALHHQFIKRDRLLARMGIGASAMRP